MNITLFLSLMFYSLAAFAASDNYISFIGGGGEPAGAPTTQFDQSAINFSSFYQNEKSNYNVSINFNGGHTETEQMITEKFNGAGIVNGFNQASFDNMIADYTQKLEKNEIPENGKILIFINSHGGETKGLTHEVSASSAAMTNMNTGSKDGMISLDALAKLTALAEAKNIKMAIIDGSCHSGNSLKLANSKTCVVTASGPKHYGYSNFPEIFAAKMIRGKNLEEIFLATRDATGGSGFPEISTPEGLLVQDELYPLLTPFMYYHAEYRGIQLDKIDTYLKSNAKTYLPNACERENEVIKLNTLMKLIEDLSAVEKGLLRKRMERTINLDSLREQIANYREVQENYLKRLNEIDLPNLKKLEPMDLGGGVRSPGYSHEELIGTDWNYFQTEKNLELQKDNLSAVKKKELEEARDYYKISQETKERVLRDNPEYQRYQAVLDELKNDTKVSRIIASSIAKEAHNAYASYYKSIQKKQNDTSKSSSNACSEFVL